MTRLQSQPGHVLEEEIGLVPTETIADRGPAGYWRNRQFPIAVPGCRISQHD